MIDNGIANSVDIRYIDIGLYKVRKWNISD